MAGQSGPVSSGWGCFLPWAVIILVGAGLGGLMKLGGSGGSGNEGNRSEQQAQQLSDPNRSAPPPERIELSDFEVAQLCDNIFEKTKIGQSEKVLWADLNIIEERWRGPGGVRQSGVWFGLGKPSAVVVPGTAKIIWFYKINDGHSMYWSWAISKSGKVLN